MILGGGTKVLHWTCAAQGRECGKLVFVQNYARLEHATRGPDSCTAERIQAQGLGRIEECRLRRLYTLRPHVHRWVIALAWRCRTNRAEISGAQMGLTEYMAVNLTVTCNFPSVLSSSSSTVVVPSCCRCLICLPPPTCVSAVSSRPSTPAAEGTRQDVEHVPHKSRTAVPHALRDKQARPGTKGGRYGLKRP